MKTLSLAFRYARRDLRGGVKGLRIVLACLALGVAAITAVGTLRAGVEAGIAADGSRILGGEILDSVHNHHNFAWREAHGGREMWVVRKGTTPARPGQRGFVGGSMGERSVILEGAESPMGIASFQSTVHGAGRVMSRTVAAGKWKGWGKRRTLVHPGAISRDMMTEWLDGFGGVELRGAGTDESPHCYKRLPEVLAAHGDTIRVLHVLTPVGVAMAGADEHDPYKD